MWADGPLFHLPSAPQFLNPPGRGAKRWGAGLPEAKTLLSHITDSQPVPLKSQRAEELTLVNERTESDE